MFRGPRYLSVFCKLARSDFRTVMSRTNVTLFRFWNTVRLSVLEPPIRFVVTVALKVSQSVLEFGAA
jgi:hypothetical protein